MYVSTPAGISEAFTTTGVYDFIKAKLRKNKRLALVANALNFAMESPQEKSGHYSKIQTWSSKLDVSGKSGSTFVGLKSLNDWRMSLKCNVFVIPNKISTARNVLTLQSNRNVNDYCS